MTVKASENASCSLACTVWLLSQSGSSCRSLPPTISSRGTGGFYAECFTFGSASAKATLLSASLCSKLVSLALLCTLLAASVTLFDGVSAATHAHRLWLLAVFGLKDDVLGDLGLRQGILNLHHTVVELRIVVLLDCRGGRA